MKALLHIGFPKTGTSSIQRYASANYESLRNQGALFVKTGRILSWKDRARHMGLHIASRPFDAPPTKVMQNYGITSDRARRRYQKRFFAKLHKEVSAQSDLETAFFSEEALSVMADPKMGRGIQAEFAKIFDKTEVFAMIREPFDYLASSYTQSVKMGSQMRWPDFRDSQLKGDLFFSQIKIWQDIFGKENVRTRVMQRDALDQFEGVLGLKLKRSEGKRLNASNSALGIELLRQLNEDYATAGKKRPSAVRQKMATHMTGPSWKPPRADIEVIYSHCQPEIDKIKTQLNLPDADLGYVNENWTSQAASAKLRDPANPYDAGKEGLSNLLMDLFK